MIAVIGGVIVVIVGPYLNDVLPSAQKGTGGSGLGASSSADPESGSTNLKGPEAPPTISLDEAVREYYEAVDRGDWAYTYDKLDAGSKANIAREEWRKKNQWFSDENPYSLTYAGLDADRSSSRSYDVTVYRESGDGFCSVQDTLFVREDGSWKHRLSEDELGALMPSVSYKRFVAAWQQDPPDGGLSRNDVMAEIEDAVRGHYEARGRADFEEAYCYFGPTYRADNSQRTWVNDQKPYDVQGVTIHSVKVRKISSDSATAIVRVSFDDDTGTQDFRVEWGLREIYGQWKLNREP